jgi:diguanylate cyclase (GGDEF)-like protein
VVERRFHVGIIQLSQQSRLLPEFQAHTDPMPVLAPLLFLLLQYGILELAPSISRPTAYIAMVAAPLLAAVATISRGRGESSPARIAWYAVAGSLLIWSLGAFGNLWQEWILGRVNEMYRGSMLAFNLAGVPIAFVLAGEWRLKRRPIADITDALTATALGLGFFLYTWSMLTARGEPDEIGVNYLIWLLDTQNLFLALGALVRWYAGETREERQLFRTICIFQSIYLALIFYNNHFVAGDASFGPEQSSVIDVAFAVLAGLALHRSSSEAALRPDPSVTRLVRGASPMLLAGALLLLSLFMIRIDYLIGTAGVLIAVLGYTLRTALNQVGHIERGDILQRERSELQMIAWTDALTGLANRHYLEQMLNQIALPGEALREQLSVLMVDIDHFKMLNDEYGHPAGDACLRTVAGVLQRCMVRPGDLVARYGGEEFIALIHNADSTGGLVVAERMRAAVEALGIENSGAPLGVLTVSVGAASALKDYREGAQGLVDAADRALYDAKHAGRNQIRGIVIG